VLVGDDPASAWYVAAKHRDCAEVGIASIQRELPATASQIQVEQVVDELNADPACTGFLVQQPTGLDECAILSRVDPDGFASRFGHRVEDDHFAAGLRLLLQDGSWRRKGEEAHAYVSEKYGFEASIAQHVEAYSRALARSGGRVGRPPVIFRA